MNKNELLHVVNHELGLPGRLDMRKGQLVEIILDAQMGAA
jgi:hypothetical protein